MIFESSHDDKVYLISRIEKAIEEKYQFLPIFARGGKMSTVLWTNVLENGKVNSDESDKHALYKYSKKLDKLTNQLNVVRFTSVQDVTDMQFNLSEEDLPDGMESTDEVMAKKGVWVSGFEAVEMLEKLISHISDDKVKFGLFSNDHEEVINELKESLIIAKKAKNINGKFNYSVVM